MNLQNLRTSANRRAAEYEHAQRTARTERREFAAARRRLRDSRAAQELLQSVAQTVQQAAHKQIAGVVTRCLAAVFGPDAYEFRIHFERRRGQTEARIVFARDGREIDPLDAAGGGAVDIAAFALRISCLILARPALRRLVVADEPFRFVSAEYRPAVRAMLETLADDLGIQFVIVTHSPEFEIGKVVRI